jgi:hypothetical protein
VTLAIGLTHGLQLWQQIIVAILFLALFTIAIVATYSATRPKTVSDDDEAVSRENVEQKVKEWTDAFGLSRKIVPDDKFHFVIVVSPRPTMHVMIRHSKDHPSYLELRSSLRTTNEQRELFDKMEKKTQESVRRTIDLECARSKIEYHSNEKLEFVCIHKQIPITPDLTDARFIDGLAEMRFAVAVVGHAINGIFKPPS